ncbi:unnamed protein product [marine sediment metagenome]|uniref:Uncharacterized protein n=1 Tax=marine sediment metagenome TaxID=412755 RepID=X1ESA8_9ZZZZ
MKPDQKPYASLEVFREPNTTLIIQAPLPDFADTLPILLSIPGQGTTRERVAPLAPPGRPANDP